MPTHAFRILALLAATHPVATAFEPLADLDEALNWSSDDGMVRLDISGTLDLEYFTYTQPAPGLIYTAGSDLFAPRLLVFADAQIGPQFYGFLQTRVDQGFDPTDGDLEIRLDEYALRWTHCDDGRFSIQLGQFATAVGNYPARSYSWQNPFVTAPVPYENMTGIWDTELPADANVLRAWGHVVPTPWLPYEAADKIERVPIVWGPAYAAGLAVMGAVGDFNYNLEIKNASLSSNPEVWPVTRRDFSYPTYSGRIGWRPNLMWNLGVSASVGPYLRDTALARSTLPPGTDLDDFNQITIAHDIAFEWHHWQFWAEVFASRFETPFVDADTLAYYLEAKYKFTPQVFGAVRFNHHLYESIPLPGGGHAPWGADLVRLDLALGWRPTSHTQVKFQFSVEHEKAAEHDWGHLFASQFTARF